MEKEKGPNTLRKRATGGSRHAATCLNLSWKKNLKALEHSQKSLGNSHPLIQYSVTNSLFDKTGCYFILSLPSPHLVVLTTSTASQGSRLCYCAPSHLVIGYLFIGWSWACTNAWHVICSFNVERHPTGGVIHRLGGIAGRNTY